MPNWVTSKLKVTNSIFLHPDDEGFLKYISVAGDGSMYFDFDKIIPMPERYKVAGVDQNIKPNWRDWSYNCWGVKWNSCRLKFVNKFEVEFQTPWDVPEPIIRAVSILNPYYEIEVSYYDEDIYGTNHGIIQYFNGDIMSEKFPINTIESLSIVINEFGNNNYIDELLCLGYDSTIPMYEIWAQYCPFEEAKFDRESRWDESLMPFKDCEY